MNDFNDVRSEISEIFVEDKENSLTLNLENNTGKMSILLTPGNPLTGSLDPLPSWLYFWVHQTKVTRLGDEWLPRLSPDKRLETLGVNRRSIGARMSDLRLNLLGTQQRSKLQGP